MHTILVAGAGKSSTYLIDYLLQHAPRNKWKIIVADGDAQAINARLKGNPSSEAIALDITQTAERQKLVQRADIVLSLMPPDLHTLLAKDCLQYGKNLITSSYVSPEIREMEAAVKSAGLTFMGEMGLDPGIDHMSANYIIHSIQRVAASITSFKSYCGGLVAPENDNNPWHYKFFWNPKNILTAGIGGAKYLSGGKHIETPYDKIFENNKKIKVDGLGTYACYPNRDSLRYLDLYDLPDAKTFIRATLRHPDFCKGWHALIMLGLTNDEQKFDTSGKTWRQWTLERSGWNQSMPQAEHLSVLLNLSADNKVFKMLDWLGVLSERVLKQGMFTPAEVLFELLLEKWTPDLHDKDLVLMQHEVEYLHKGRETKLISTMMLKGDNRDHSAMAKTVGLPMGIMARNMLSKKIVAPTGVHIPNMPQVYKPVLTELQHHGIHFVDTIE